jgi:polar amino acid transport system permease protein
MVDFNFDWFVIKKYADWFIEGAEVTLQLTLGGIAITSVLGLVIALFRMARFKPFAAFGDVYIQCFRGVPNFVFLIWLYYGLAFFTGVNIPPLIAGMACISVLRSAYVAEVYRAGVESVGKGQREAALSVGLKGSQVMRYIVLPQAIRTVLPAIGNELMVMFKATSIMGMVGVEELVKKAQWATVMSYRPFELYTFLAVIFVTVVTVFSRAVQFMERKLQYAR